MDFDPQQCWDITVFYLVWDFTGWLLLLVWSYVIEIEIKNMII